MSETIVSSRVWSKPTEDGPDPAPGLVKINRRRSAAFARVREVLYPLITFASLIAIWWLAIIIFQIPPYLLPSPPQVIAALVDNWGYLAANALPTLQIMGLGYLLAVLLAIPLGAAIASSKTVEKFVYPLLVVTQTIPKIAIAPILVIWFGFGPTPKIFIAVLLAFFPIVITTAAGLLSVPSDMDDLSRSMRMSKLSTFRKVRFPYALPSIFSGLKSAITLAVMGAIVGEFVGSDRGLGYVLQIASGRLETDLVFATVLLLVVIGMVSFVVIQVIERLAVPWHESIRKQR